MYYATVAAAAALHQVLLRSLGDDKVVVQNVASGLFCVLFVALGVAGRPTLLATTMLGYLISDSTSVTTASYAAHRCVEIAGVASMAWRTTRRFSSSGERAVKF